MQGSLLSTKYNYLAGLLNRQTIGKDKNAERCLVQDNVRVLVPHARGFFALAPPCSMQWGEHLRVSEMFPQTLNIFPKHPY